MSSAPPLCIYCNKEYKSSDSRPYPNSKSKERIHNKCLIKKNLIDKKQPASRDTAQSNNDDQLIKPTTGTSVLSLIEKVSNEQFPLKEALKNRHLMKMIEGNSVELQKKNDNSSQFFYDLKAGIAKPHEKKRYLHHRNITEIATRYDDNGFHDEAAGRTYDHTGKDLNTLDGSDDDNESDVEPEDIPLDSNDIVQVSVGNKRPPEYKTSEGRKQTRIKLDDQNPCWFCLSSINVEKHLIVAIGDFCYLTLAKGGLTDEHFLLIPIEHIQSLNDELNSKNLLEELEKFKLSIIDYFGTQAMGVVFFERNFRSVHWQLQAVPIPLDLIDTVEENIKSKSKDYFKNSNYLDIPSSCSLSDVIPPSVPYVYWQLEPTGSRFVSPIQTKGSFFPVQLGRLVLADPSILNCLDKVNWKKSAKTKEEYIDLVKRIKFNYKKFDIT